MTICSDCYNEWDAALMTFMPDGEIICPDCVRICGGCGRKFHIDELCDDGNCVECGIINLICDHCKKPAGSCRTCKITNAASAAIENDEGD